MQEYLRARGVIADLVIVNEQASSYVQDLQQAIEWHCDNARLRGGEHGPRQHIFAVRRDLMDERTYRTLLAGRARSCCTPATARSSTRSSAPSSGELQLESWQPSARRCRKPCRAQRGLPRPLAPMRRDSEPDGSDLAFWNGYGGFAEDGREYVVRLAGDRFDAAALDQRDLQRGVRLPHLGRGRVVHLEPQQPRLPADAVVERSGAQPTGRGDLHLRPCVGPRLLAVRRGGPRPVVTYETRHGQGYSIFSATRGNARRRADAARRSRRSGEDVAAE